VVRPDLQHGRMKGELTGGAHMAMTKERKDITAKMRKPEETAPCWRIRQGALGRWTKWGRWRPMGEVGQCGEAGPAGLDPRGGFKQNLISNFKGFGNLARLGEFLR
jgi:hypothetical protein